VTSVVENLVVKRCDHGRRPTLLVYNGQPEQFRAAFPRLYSRLSSSRRGPGVVELVRSDLRLAEGVA